MADSNGTEIIRLSDHMFTKKSMLDTLHQAIAEEIYPERANFTVDRTEGSEYADLLVTSYPPQTRRDLASAMGALTRPKSQQWFSANVAENLRTDRVKWWLGKVTDRQRDLLYKQKAGFQRAIQTTDDDVVAFGNGIIGHVESSDRDGLVIYDAYHPKDCAWSEDEHRMVNVLTRKFWLQLCNWEKKFPKVKMPSDYEEIKKKNPYHKVCIVHIVMPAGHYDPYTKKFGRFPWNSIYVDRQHQIVLKEGGYFEFPYTVRRWKLNDCSQYAYSPAAVLGLVEARLLQAQTKVILDAGERAVDPPTIATRDAVLGDISTYAGGTTWVEGDYDERLGAAVKVMEQGGNLQLGLEMVQDTRAILQAAQYLNKLTLPSDKEMTAYETQERIQEYIRSVGPVVEPFQDDNSMILDASFSMNLRLGNFGPKEVIPPELVGADIQYEFDGPLQMAYKRIKLNHGKEMMGNVVELVTGLATAQYPDAYKPLDNVDLDKWTRDVSSFSNGDDWLKPVEEMLAQREQAAAAQQAVMDQQTQAQEIANAGAVADVVPKVDLANQSINNIVADNDDGGEDDDEYPDVGEDENENAAVA